MNNNFKGWLTRDAISILNQAKLRLAEGNLSEAAEFAKSVAAWGKYTEDLAVDHDVPQQPKTESPAFASIGGCSGGTYPTHHD